MAHVTQCSTIHTTFIEREKKCQASGDVAAFFPYYDFLLK